MLKFICIGAQKSGTTWLYSVLKEHSEIYLPPIKEVNFFYEVYVGANDNLKKRFLGNHWMNLRWRRILKTKLLNINLAQEEREWYLKYLFTKPNFEKNGFLFYQSLFENKEMKTSGDLTPNYSVLPLRIIKQIKNNLPDVKILLILRDPIQRDWSALKMDLAERKNRLLSDIKENEIEKYLSNTNERSKYTKIINNWGSVYKDNLKIFFYDELKLNPHDFFKKICDFLEISYIGDIKTLEKKIFTGIKKQIPENHLRHLSKMYYPMLNSLTENEYLENVSFVNNWIKKCKNYL